MEKQLFKYSHLDFGTRIFFKGDKRSPMSYGTIKGELSNGEYVIEMDINESTFIVHPERFEDFGGLFQVEAEREAKVSWLCLN